MRDETHGDSGLPRDIEEWLLLSHSRKLNREEDTRKLTVDVPETTHEAIAELAEQLHVTRGDLVAYLWTQSGERVHWLREYLKRPGEPQE